MIGPVTVEVRLLGPVELVVDGVSATPGGLRPRAVLAVLAASGEAPVNAARLAEAIYSDTGKPASRATVQVHVHNLRQNLGAHGGSLLHGPAGYRLLGVRADIREAEDAIGRARAAERARDTGGAAAGYRRALEVWRGPFCADLPDHTAFDPARALYAEMRWEALEARIAADLRAGDVPGLVRELEDLVSEHPLRERFWGQLMVALYQDGRQAEALDRFRQARRILAEEAGVDPGPALRELERAVLAHAGTATLLRVAAPGAAGAGRPALTWVDGSGRARLRELPVLGRLAIGRDASADVALRHDGAVSRDHAEITVGESGAVLVDLGSRNGTFHNGERVAGPVPLAPGDVVRCGDTVLAVTSGGAAVSPVDGTTR
ncbi:BTAD domain-containing putative transcriptional regulator [Amycolatopsis sp. WAC 01375]|uniref:BTAD domain-containing putative transcriptional regulator n=1 Tax=Amycolatopsis sp. WAC 01375 TaxID=2203194 RepID=UPI0013156DC4|nr:BTAD domain-containing putative transcriptional regulator [Amycolatopsis sp. WAC 01375]